MKVRLTCYSLRRHGLPFLLACVLAVISGPATAEVTDKEMPLAGVWAWGLGGAVVIYFVARYLHWSLAVICLLAASLVPWAILQEVHDPHVGPAIVREAGLTYVLSAHASLALVWGAAIMGVYLRRRRRGAGLGNS